jgi:hypothetical protein
VRRRVHRQPIEGDEFGPGGFDGETSAHFDNRPVVLSEKKQRRPVRARADRSALCGNGFIFESTSSRIQR